MLKLILCSTRRHIFAGIIEKVLIYLASEQYIDIIKKQLQNKHQYTCANKICEDWGHKRIESADQFSRLHITFMTL